jgi:Bacterial CdiA-CT RNAse A domain
MTYFHPAAVEHRRKLYERQDAWRLAPPGTPEARMPGWLDPSATRVRLKEAQEEARAAFEAQVAELRASHERLKAELAEISYELAWRKLCRKYGYNPDQPRDDHGRWTSGANAVGNAVATDDSSPDSDLTLSDERPDPVTPGAQYAQGGRPIDLLEEQQLGGHAIEGHVGKSQEFLLGRTRELAVSAERKGDFVDGIRVGSFSSLEGANKLVNATIAQNPGKIELVTSGRSPREELVGRFDSVTGYEAYARTERSQPYIRDTDGVMVVIIPDRRAEKGYRVDSAFPVRFGR